MNSLVRVLKIASNFVEQNQEWADRVRQNWSSNNQEEHEMKLHFNTWLRTSNETADIRQAFELWDKLPRTLSKDTLYAIHNAIIQEAEKRWSETKKALS